MIETPTLSFKQVPKIPPLFLDYLYNFSRLESFFPPFLPHRFDRDAASRRIPAKDHRDELVQVLETQNRDYGSSGKVFENLQRLKREGCAAVVTGQQVGIFTGPMYTVLKALTAVKLAEEYTRRGLDSVPVFWLASDDHDLAEVDHCWLANSEGLLQKVRYSSSTAGGSVGAISFNEAIANTVAEFAAAMPDTEFKQSLCSRLQHAYRPGNTFSRAFGELLAHWFAEFGLIIMDPQEPRLKALIRPLQSQVVSDFEGLKSALAERNRQLESAGYPLQVKTDIDALPLFMDLEGQRRGLIAEGQEIAIKGGGPRFSREQLLAKINETPELFSPNVLLRPLCQDLLLPTAAYVGGPAEIAYFSQAGALYQWWGQPLPVIFPRASVTLVERKIQKVLSKWELQFQDLFRGEETLLRQVIGKNLDPNASAMLEDTELSIEQLLEKWEPILRSVDPTLVEALRNSKSKILYQLTTLRNKFLQAAGRQQEVTTRQVQRLFALLYPEKSLQERSLNIVYFLDRYGEGLLNQLYAEIDLENLDHRLFLL